VLPLISSFFLLCHAVNDHDFQSAYITGNRTFSNIHDSAYILPFFQEKYRQAATVQLHRKIFFFRPVLINRKALSGYATDKKRHGTEIPCLLKTKLYFRTFLYYVQCAALKRGYPFFSPQSSSVSSYPLSGTSSTEQPFPSAWEHFI